jgi:integrase
LLADMRTAAGSAPFLFPGAKGKPQSGLKKFWATICRDAHLASVRVHDLRHTFASVLASSGLSLPIIGKLLGHSQAATTQRYAHLLDDPLRTAAERAGAVITGSAEAKIVPLHRGARR